MIGKAAAGIAAAVVGMLLLCAGAVGIFLTGGAGTDTGTATSTSCDATLTAATGTTADAGSGAGGRATVPTVARSDPPVGRWTSTQVGNAAIIIATGAHLHIPAQGLVIAVATAMQESSLHNYGNLGGRNDHDSLGLFQQRPSQGWGTPAQILNPAHAATSFYQHLLRVRGWQTLPLTQAAQAVQRSAFPTAYAQWEQPATTLVHTITGQPAVAVVDCAATSNAAAGITAATGWTVPVRGAITSGFRTRDRPHHDGVDIAANRGTLIHAAAAGTVTTVACTAHTPTGLDVGCDTDGTRTLSGLGWYVTITHPGGITTTYGHQLIHPLVDVGQPVAAGDIIGLVGSSGDSSGPHLYFQITVAGTPVDPVAYMAGHDAPLAN